MVRIIWLLALITVLSAPQTVTANNHEKGAITLKPVVVKPEAHARVQFYSNAAVNEVKFRYQPSASADEVVTVAILKSSGVQVRAFTLSTGLTKVKTHNLKPGIYQYQCTDADGREIITGSFTVAF